MYNWFIQLARSHEQYISATPDLGRALGANDVESNALAIRLSVLMVDITG